MSRSSFKPIMKPGLPALAAPRARALSITLPRSRLTAIRPIMVELGCLRRADAAYPGPEVLEAVARRLLRE